MTKPLNHLLWVCLLVAHTVTAQDKQGSLKGTVLDSLQKSLSYATVNLYKWNQTAQAYKTTYTNTKGTFKLDADTGKYVLTVSHTGFGDLTTSITIQAGENIVDSLMLTKEVRSLPNITVTARKPLIEQRDDRIIYNAENDPASRSESASDILRKTPLVTVDGDGNVQLNGQSNFKILLNGRETSMFAMNVKDALKNFPGAVVSKIEVITSPSAKYDAEGIGGIINIITKKKVIGYNGYLSSYYSTLGNLSENISLNMKSGKIGISGYVGENHNVKSFKNTSITETTPVDKTSFSKRTLNGQRESRNKGYYANIEVVYDIDSFKTIAFYGNLDQNRNKSLNDQDIFTERVSQPTLTSLYLQQNNSSNPGSGAGMDYIRRFRNSTDKELTIRVNGQFNKSHGNNISSQESQLQNRYVDNESLSKNREYTAQLDFTQPLKKNQRVETGVKAILRSASSDFQSLVKYQAGDDYKSDPSNSDRFHYHQEVYSGYVSYNLPLKKITLRTGVRIEYTNVNGNFETVQAKVKQSYVNVIPNLLVTRKFSKTYTLIGSYNLRLQRPYITNLNPFVNNNDSLNISYGNPDLGPQVLHAVSIQNRIVKGKTFFSISINTSYTDTRIVQYASFNAATGVTSITSANIGKEFQGSLGLNLNTPLSEKLNIGVGGQLRYNKIENKSNLLQTGEGISGVVYGNFYYKMFAKFTLSGSGGMSRNPYSLVNSPSNQYFYQVNFGYKFFKEKLAVTMNVNNFHSKYIHFKTITEDPNFTIVSNTRSPFLVIYFGATYNFGKLKESISKKKGVNNDDLL